MNYYFYTYNHVSYGIKGTVFPSLAIFSLFLTRICWLLIISAFFLNWVQNGSCPEGYSFEVLDSILKPNQSLSFDFIVLSMLLYAVSLVLSSANIVLTLFYEGIVKPEKKENADPSRYLYFVFFTSAWYLVGLRLFIQTALYLLCFDEKLILILHCKPANYTVFIFLVVVLLVIHVYVPGDVLHKQQKIKK